jgi:hypothetical protein
LSLAFLSCARQTAAPPLPDYTQAQREIWSQMPAGGTFGMAAARFGHLLDRARALRSIVSAGPTTRRKLDMLLARAQTKLGFDPLDAAAWSAHGIIVDAPVGLFGDDGSDKGAVLVAVSDAAKASAVLEPLFATKCRAHGRWLACGDDMKLPDAADQSRWPDVAKDPLVRSELLVLARIPAKPEAGEFFAAPQSIVGGLDLGEERIAMQVRYRNPQSGMLKPYVTRDPGGKSLLAAARGALAFARFSFSPKALWDLAQRKSSRESIEQASSQLLMATGIDLKADLVDNLTGEIFGGLWDSSSVMSTLLIGTRDDARTTDLARRLDSILAGVVASYNGRAGVKTSRAVEKSHGRQVYVYKADVAQLVKSLNIGTGLSELELHLCAAPGALVISFDRANREHALAALGGKAGDFLNGLDPEVRRALTSDAVMTGWGHGTDFSTWYKSPTGQQMLQMYAGIDRDAPALLTEMAALSELIYDQTIVLAVHDQDVSLDWTLRLL